MKCKFKRDYLRDELDLPGIKKTDKRTIISDDIVDQSRWSTMHELIFQLPDQAPNEAWCVYYSHGSTESQDESPWEYEDKVEAILVHAVEKTVTVWEEIK